MGIRHSGDQPIGTFNRHITVCGQVIGPIDQIGAQPAHGAGINQLIPFGIAPNGGQQRRCQPKARQGHADVQGHATGQAGDAPRHVRALLHRLFGPSDDIPQDGTDA